MCSYVWLISWWLIKLFVEFLNSHKTILWSLQMELVFPLSQQVVSEPRFFWWILSMWIKLEDISNTLIKLVKAQWSLKEDYVWYKVSTAHTSMTMTMEKMMILFKEGLLWLRWIYSKKERRLLDGIWVKVDIVGKVP